jgi:hypothetical protein
MPATPIRLHLVHADGFQTEIAEQPDGTLRVIVAGMVRRMWQAERATIDEAIALAFRIRCEQAAGLVSRSPDEAAPGTPLLPVPAPAASAASDAGDKPPGTAQTTHH